MLPPPQPRSAQPPSCSISAFAGRAEEPAGRPPAVEETARTRPPDQDIPAFPPPPAMRVPIRGSAFPLTGRRCAAPFRPPSIARRAPAERARRDGRLVHPHAGHCRYRGTGPRRSLFRPCQRLDEGRVTLSGYAADRAALEKLPAELARIGVSEVSVASVRSLSAVYCRMLDSLAPQIERNWDAGLVFGIHAARTGGRIPGGRQTRVGPRSHLQPTVILR